MMRALEKHLKPNGRLELEYQLDLPSRTQVIFDFPVGIYVPKFGDYESEKKWILDNNARHIDTNLCLKMTRT